MTIRTDEMSRKIRDKFSKEFLELEYLVKKKSTTIIAKENKVSQSIISRRLKGKDGATFGISRSGKNNPFYGKHHTDKFKKEQSLRNGGTDIPHENSDYPPEFNDKLKEQIRKRDNYTCQNCNIAEEEHIIVFGSVLHVHHIDYDKNNCSEDNLISLCRACHMRTNKNRKYWISFCNSKINIQIDN